MYIGNDLQIAHPSYKIIDDISSGFNGSTTSFALQVNGATPVPFPISTQQVMISVNGVVQEPDPGGSAGFKLLGSNIVFSSAPANGHAFFGVINAGADYVTAGSEFPDGSVTAPSFTFQDDQDTGWYRISSGSVGYSANGVQILDFDGNGLNIPDNKKLQIGSGTDLQLYHDGSHSYIAETGTGRLHINTSQLRVNNAADNEILISATENGSVELYYDSVKKFHTTSGGVYVTGDLDTNGGAIVSNGGHIRTNSDSGRIKAGASNDLEIYHDGSHSYINNTGTGNLYIVNDNGGTINLQTNGSENAVKCIENGAVELYYDNSKKFETTSSGSKTTGTLHATSTGVVARFEREGTANGKYDFQLFNDAGTDCSLALIDSKASATRLTITSAGNLQIPDNGKLQLGDGADLQIYHDGTASYIDETGTGSLIIQSNTVQINNAGGTEVQAKFIENGAVELYYDNSLKFKTSSGGAHSYGVLSTSNDITIGNSSDLTFEDDGKAKFGTGSDLQIWHDGSHTRFKNITGNLNIQSTAFVVTNHGNTENLIIATQNGAVELYYDGSKKFETTSYGIKASSVKVFDNEYFYAGNNSDLQISHDGSNSTILNQTGYLALNTNTAVIRSVAQETGLVYTANGSVDLYYDGSKKFETTSSGINVTGAINVNGSPLSSAPTITATASGSIGSGKAVIVNSNGTVSQPAITAPAFGSATQINTSNTNGSHDIIWCQAHNCFIYAWKDDSNNYGKIKAGTISGTTITWGSEVTFHSGAAYHMKLAYDSINDVIFVAYRNGSYSYRCEVRQIQISGTTIGTVSSAGTPYSNNTVEQLNLAYGNGACVLTFKYASQGRAIKITANSTASNHPNSSSSYQIESNNYNSNALVYDPDEDKFVTCWNDQDSQAGRSRVMTLTSDNEISMSSTTDWTSDYTDYISLTYNTNLNKYLVVWQRNQSNGYKNLYSAVGTYSGGTITWANEVEHTTTNNERHINSAYNPNTFKHSVYWQAGNDSNKLKHADITISGTTPSLGTVTTLSTVGSDGEYNETAVSDAGAEVNISDTNNDEYYVARSIQSTSLTTSNFIGFSSAAYSDGNTATINVVGATSTQSSLTPGQKYYVQNDGSLGLTAGDPNVYAGIAIATNNLLIKG